jgi:hypothetical protein
VKRFLPSIVTGLLLAATVFLVSACVGYVDGGPDYYGPGYGDVYYGHPYYRGDVYIGNPGYRHWRR